MISFGKVIKRTIGVVNLFFICVMLIVAYSEQIPPQSHHLLSLLGLSFPVFALINLCFLLFWLIIGQFKYMLFPVVGFLFCGAQTRATFPLNVFQDTPPAQSYKLLSYNVMSFRWHEKVEGGNAILNYIKESDADLICLQEYALSGNKQRLTQKDVDKAMESYPYHHVHTKAPSLACYSKFPILSATPIVKGNNSNGAMAYEILMDADTVLLINCHLQSNQLTKEDKETYEDIIDAPETAKVKEGLRLFARKLGEATAKRAPQADTIARVIAESPHSHVIVMGDFNDPPVSYAHHTIGKGLKDAFAQSGTGFGISYHENHFYFRIDNIMISPDLQSYDCQVDNSIKDSDHYPIWCQVAKKD